MEVYPPQPGVIEEGKRFALFLVMKVSQRRKPIDAAIRGCIEIHGQAEMLKKMVPSGGLSCTVSFGAEFWKVVSPGRQPGLIRPFKGIKKGERRAPATGGDILLHISSDRYDLNFELARRSLANMGNGVKILEEVNGFTYLDSRDLTGFIDGTANPKGAERAEVALIGEEDPPFAGGSYVMTQRYVHDLAKWGKIPELEQERLLTSV